MMPLPDPPLPKPEEIFLAVSDIGIAAGMSEDEFDDFKQIVRLYAKRYLDVSGLVSVDDQDPLALVSFLDTVKKHDPTLNRKYADAWPILVYLRQYLDNRHRERCKSRWQNGKGTRSTWKSTRSSSPIGLRHANSVNTGDSFQRPSSRAARATGRGFDQPSNNGITGSVWPGGPLLWLPLGFLCAYLVNVIFK